VKIRSRIFLGFAAILSIGFYFLISWILTDVKVQPKKSMEETLVDTAHILASYLEQKMEDIEISTGELEKVLDKAFQREFSAQIYELTKDRINLGIYVTDKYGFVIYDSNNGAKVGEDFSGWHDVKRTLEGEYGARTTRTDPDNPVSSVAYVAAPIYYNGEIVGVCSVSKPWKSIHSFVQSTQKKIIIAAIIGFFIILLLSYLISLWITRPILQLINYAHSVKEGIRVTLPDLGKGEIKTLGESFEKMRESLEGKKYIEKYIQTLTHQIKGPLSSIRGASELLQEGPPPENQARFISNIRKESERIQLIVDRLLELSSIEKRRELQNIEKIELRSIVEEIIESISPVLDQKKIKCYFEATNSFYFYGEIFLIKQAVFNLFQNAVDFTPKNGTITVQLDASLNHINLRIKDTGFGIPDYALPRVFDKFYSLPRPDSGQKSSGLGLSLVNEVIQLHGGEVSLKNNKSKGITATIRIPKV
jgi:two-component system sensor histidine kinase CreC